MQELVYSNTLLTLRSVKIIGCIACEDVETLLDAERNVLAFTLSPV